MDKFIGTKFKQNMSYLIPDRDPRNATPALRTFQAGQVALLESQVWQWREVLPPRDRSDDPTRVDNI